MQLVDVLRYVLLTISVTTCAQADTLNTNAIQQPDRVLSKRDTTLLSSNYESKPLYYTPNIIYKKISRSSYRRQKPKQTARRIKPTYGQLAYSQNHPVHRPRKNYKNAHYITQKPSYNDKRKPYQSKHKIYGYNRGPSVKPGTKKPTYRYKPYLDNYDSKHKDINEQKVRDFGEPKLRDYGQSAMSEYIDHKIKDYAEAPRIRDYSETNFKNYNEPKPNDFGEPPIRDSVAGEPYMDIYRPKPAFLENPEPVEEGTTNFKTVADPSLFDENEFKLFNSFKHDSPSHKRFTFHKKHPVYMKASDNFKSNFDNLDSNHYGRGSKRAPSVKYSKFVNSAWKTQEDGNVEEDVVGGQYAEPPARYVPKFQPSAPMFRGEDDFEPPMSFDDEEAPSATAASAYVNYKNSNMAFSPQNLNDAFSVDK